MDIQLDYFIVWASARGKFSLANLAKADQICLANQSAAIDAKVFALPDRGRTKFKFYRTEQIFTGPNTNLYRTEKKTPKDLSNYD